MEKTPDIPERYEEGREDDGSSRTTRQHAKAVDESVRSMPGRVVVILYLTAGVGKTPDTPERYEEGRDG